MKIFYLLSLTLNILLQIGKCTPRGQGRINHWTNRIFSVGCNVEILLILQVSDDAIQTVVHKTLYPFYPFSLCWLDLNSQYFVRNVFYA